jgi:TolB-like protein
MRARFWVSLALAVSVYAVTSEAQQAGSANQPLATLALDNAAVAILPLEVLSLDPKASQLAAALYEAILREIGATNGLRVVDPSRARPFADSALDPEEVARALGVGGVITGTVRVREGRWSVFLKEHGWSAGWDVGDATSDSLSTERILEVASEIAAMVERGAFPIRFPSQQQIIEDVRATVLDASLPDGERVEALNEFPFVKNAGPGQVKSRTEALGGYVAETLAQIAIDAEEPIVRFRAWHGLTGVRDLSLVRPLLAGLADDADVLVRKAAADRLMEGFPDELDVQAGLEFAVENDASEDVRNHIRFAFLSDQEQQEKLRAAALDSGKSDRERVVAIGQLSYVDGEFKELDHDIVVVALEISRHSDSSLLRSYAWGFLSDSRDLYLVEPYLELLATDPNEEVRETVALGLGEFLDRPGVRDALDKATSDSSIVVRRAAAESLQGS